MSEAEQIIKKQKSKGLSLSLVLLAYLVAGAAAWATIWIFEDLSLLWKAALADGVAMLVVFGFSVAYNNSSTYDPYWSVAPIPIVIYWGLNNPAVDPWRFGLLAGLVGLWGLRLTWNWARGWPGLHHEDWRYDNFRKQSGKAYWLVSFSGIHAFPSFMVFGGLLAAWVALTLGSRPINWLDGVAAAVTLVAIVIEAISDRQLRRHIRSPDFKPDATFNKGLWRFSRHPNYFGEVGFWWGLGLFALAAAPEHYWALAGALSMTSMFLIVSIPMIDKRMLARRADYAERMKTTSALIPWPPRRS
ncbi:MAG: DUF1295 domain-containing protein [Deltaproteobacteria bacterium]|nr:DUF1295 domain-containing protein [Deltaproteobacteria bacterium]